MSAGNGRSTVLTVEPLTRREREILALLALGYSGPEIADQLTLALSSVRWHLKQVYTKLGVNTKRQAVTRAHALGLLPVAAGAAPHAASPIPPSSPNHNLPLQVNRFFGRQDEIAQVEARLAEQRLVTLVGPGGVGKTRLSHQVAEAQLRGQAHGVWLVELAPLADAEQVARQVAFILGVGEEPGRAIRETLMAYLRSRQLLLVLDNCEHLLAACAQLTDGLLRACPALKILATSREPLGTAGEAVFPVSPLPVPDPQLAASVEGMGSFASVSLFADRAGLVWPDFKITAGNIATLARICWRLDGLPLAIEMAAARVNLLTVDQIASRLDDVFRLLTGGSRTALPRQQTLRATIDWSYNLLSEAERLLLQRLSVFAGGCVLEAAEAVCSGEGLAAHAILDLLGSLVAKSMIGVTRPSSGVARYSLLEMVRQYGREKLEQAGDTTRRFSCHRDYFLALAETAEHEILALNVDVGADKIISNQANLRVAVQWSFSDQGGQVAVDAGPRLVRVLIHVEDFTTQEGLDWSSRVLAWCRAHPDISASVYARVLGEIAYLQATHDWSAGIAGLRRAVALSRQLGPTGWVTLMWNLSYLGTQLASQGCAEEAQAAYAEADNLLVELGPAGLTAGEFQLHQGEFATAQGQLANLRGHHADAIRLAGVSIRLQQANPKNWSGMGGHTEAGLAYLALGQLAEARDHFGQALQFAESVESLHAQAHLKWCLGRVELHQGRLARALEYCRASATQASQIAVLPVMAMALGTAAVIAAKQDQPHRAATLSGASHTRYAQSGRHPAEDTNLDTLLPDWRDGLERSAIEQAYAAGQAMTNDEAIAFALSDALS